MTWTPPKPPNQTRAALLGGVFKQQGLSMLNLLPQAAYRIQMGVARLAGRGLFLVNAPETARRVMNECPADFPKHHYIEDILRPLIGVSLFNANGEVWQRQRRLVDQAFVQAALRRVFPVMLEAMDDMLVRLEKAAQAGTAWEAEEAMGHVTADIIFRTILSTPLDVSAATDVHQAFRSYQEAAQRVMGLSALKLPTFWHRRKCARMGTAIRESYAPLIRQRYAAWQAGDAGPDDMLGTLMQARDPVSGDTLSETDLIDQVGTLFLAGHETSASTLAWALYLLAHQPDTQEAVRQEVNALWQERPPRFGDTRLLEKTHNVFRETLRLYPPIAFYVRESREATCLRDKPVARGDMVVISPWVMHRHESHWVEPDAFDPGRFAQSGPSRSAYLPFGLGERACPGAAFATQESVLILAKLLQRFRVEPLASHTPRPTARLTLRSANGIALRLHALGGGSR